MRVFHGVLVVLFASLALVATLEWFRNDFSLLADVKHTPAPWDISGIWLFAGDDCNPIARAVYGKDSVSFEEAKANARLIAAAPDLLAAGVKVLDAMFGPLECSHGNVGDEDICDGCAYEREKRMGRAASDMRAAIAKAEGR